MTPTRTLPHICLCVQPCPGPSTATLASMHARHTVLPKRTSDQSVVISTSPPHEHSAFCCRALAAAVGAVPAFGAISAARAEDAQGVASSRMSYSRFLEYLDMGRVKKVRHTLLCSVSLGSM